MVSKAFKELFHRVQIMAKKKRAVKYNGRKPSRKSKASKVKKIKKYLKTRNHKKGKKKR